MTEDEASPDKVDELTREIQRVCAQFSGPTQFADAMNEMEMLRDQVDNLEQGIKSALEMLKRLLMQCETGASDKLMAHTIRWVITYLERDAEKMVELIGVDLATLGYDNDRG